MSDSVRMIDLVALSKSLDSVRRIDPENRAAAQRLAAAAAAQKIEEHHKDVEESRDTDQASFRDRGQRHGRPDTQGADERGLEEESSAEPVPESDEGHLLDLKV